MTPVLSAGHTHISYDYYQASAFHENAPTFPPDLVQFVEERFVVIQVTQLPGCISVVLEIPVWWRSDDEMDGFVTYTVKVPCITEQQPMFSRNLTK
jgi:hypothetical protein